MLHDLVRTDVVRNVPDFVRVLNSPLHGFGIFAAVPLRRGTVVGQYQGTMSRECPVDRTFVMRVDVDDDDHFYVDASNPLISNFTRYINDPGPLCDGNCEFLQNDLFIQVVTRRAIDQNEELTAQYLDWHSPLGGDDAESDDEVVSIDARPKRQAASVPARARPKAAVPRATGTRAAEPPADSDLAELRAEIRALRQPKVNVAVPAEASQVAPTRDHEMAELRAELRALRQPQANVTVPQVAPTSDKEMAELRAELRRLRERPPQAVPQQASPQGNELAELRAELRALRQRPAQEPSATANLPSCAQNSRR